MNSRQGTSLQDSTGPARSCSAGEDAARSTALASIAGHLVEGWGDAGSEEWSGNRLLNELVRYLKHSMVRVYFEREFEADFRKEFRLPRANRLGQSMLRRDPDQHRGCGRALESLQGKSPVCPGKPVRRRRAASSEEENEVRVVNEPSSQQGGLASRLEIGQKGA